MNTLRNINIHKSNKINLDINTTVFIHNKKKPLKTELNKFIKISQKYNTLLQEIDQKFKSNPRQESIIIISDPTQEGKFHKIIVIGYPIDNISSQGVGFDEYRHIGFKIFKGMSSNQVKSINIICPDTYKNLECVLEGLLLSTYKFDIYKTSARIDEARNFNIETLNVIDIENSPRFNKNINCLINKIESVFLCKNLVNLPPNDLNPELFTKHIRNIITNSKLPIKIEEYDSQQLKKMGMNLLYTVGKTSKGNNSRLVILSYKPTNKKNPDYVLLGKGITYDSGGLNLKPGKYLNEGKFDMSGAAVVLSSLIGAVLNGSKKSIVVYLPLSENNIDSSSMKVGEVITAYNKSTVEIDNTDAEGRLILADCLSHAVEKYPKSPIIDIATLTGQQEDLSCRLFTTLQGTNNESISNFLIENGDLLNENVIQIPIKFQLKKKLESKIADIKNSSGKCNADLILSSIFMSHFINKDTNWTHLDIAGPSILNNEDIPYVLGESSGIGVRLMIELLI